MRTIDFRFHCNKVLPPGKTARPRDCFVRAPDRESLHRGIWVDMAYEAETRPASASGRRPHAKRCSYHPERVATATPYPEEWMNQPFPR